MGGLTCLGVLVYIGINREDTSFPEYDDADVVEVDSVTDQEPVEVGEHLDPDAGPDKNGTVKFSHQRNAGTFLEVDGKPGDPVSSVISPQRNVGTFLSVDGIASDFVVHNEPKVVNIGELMDPNGSE